MIRRPIVTTFSEPLDFGILGDIDCTITVQYYFPDPALDLPSTLNIIGVSGGQHHTDLTDLLLGFMPEEDLHALEDDLCADLDANPPVKGE